MLNRKVIPALMLCCIVALTVQAKVAATTVEELTRVSDYIVIGRVTKVGRALGLGARVATLEVEQTLKGKPGSSRIQFLAQPTWVCDISDAEEGERGLFFLEARRGASRIPVIGGSLMSPSVKLITWSGRGRMPIHKVGQEEYVTLWTGDVRLPSTIRTIDGPEPEYTSFIRSVRLSDIVALVRHNLDSTVVAEATR